MIAKADGRPRLFGIMAFAGLLLAYLTLVALRESWRESIKLVAEGLPPVAGGVAGVWAFGQDFTILAQLALVFVFAMAVGFAVRPARTAVFALVPSLAAALVAAWLWFDVGAATFAAFAVPLLSGTILLAVIHLYRHSENA
jgi:hypothetical protein